MNGMTATLKRTKGCSSSAVGGAPLDGPGEPVDQRRR